MMVKSSRLGSICVKAPNRFNAYRSLGLTTVKSYPKGCRYCVFH